MDMWRLPTLGLGGDTRNIHLVCALSGLQDGHRLAVGLRNGGVDALIQRANTGNAKAGYEEMYLMICDTTLPNLAYSAKGTTPPAVQREKKG